jgi:hypothetical protein
MSTRCVDPWKINERFNEHLHGKGPMHARLCGRRCAEAVGTDQPYTLSLKLRFKGRRRRARLFSRLCY